MSPVAYYMVICSSLILHESKHHQCQHCLGHDCCHECYKDKYYIGCQHRVDGQAKQERMKGQGTRRKTKGKERRKRSEGEAIDYPSY